MLTEELFVTRSLPSALEGFRGFHAGGIFLVCGCGVSVSGFTVPPGVITIGVNDIGRSFQPDYLLVLNPRKDFAGDRFTYVENSRAKAIFTQLDLEIRHEHVIRVPMGRRGGVFVPRPAALHYTSNSPYAAVSLAMFMGARTIGIIGVDFTDHHFFAESGRHPLTRHLRRIDLEYRALHNACLRQGINLVNLSRVSRLTGVPKVSQEEFMSMQEASALPGQDTSGAMKRRSALPVGDVTPGVRILPLGLSTQWWNPPPRHFRS